MFDGSSVTSARACTLSTVTPFDTFATVASTSRLPVTSPFICGFPLVVAERRHVELAADALQVEIRDGRVGAVGDVILIHRKSGGAALRDLRACNRGRLEDQIASHVRSGAGSAGDVIGRVDAGIRGRN